MSALIFGNDLAFCLLLIKAKYNMKSKIKLVSIICVCAFVLLSYLCFSKQELRSITSENIEALADSSMGDYWCLGRGSVECPTGHKVEYMVANYR